MFGPVPHARLKTGPAHDGAAAVRNEVPFFLGRMHDAVDRLFDRFEREWPLAAADGWNPPPRPREPNSPEYNKALGEAFAKFVKEQGEAYRINKFVVVAAKK